MKSILIAAAILAVAGPARAQSPSYATMEKSSLSPIILSPSPGAGEYKVSRIPGERMRNAGRTLAILGGAMLIGGIIVYSNAEDSYYSTYTYNGSTYEEGDPKAALGILMMLGGTGMTVPGIILWTKGSKKYKRHLERMDMNNTVSFNVKGSGLGLHYKF